MGDFIRNKANISYNDGQLQLQIGYVSSYFYNAAWNLCRRGILRPGASCYRGQETSFNDGYSVTSFGGQWLQESNQDDYVPTEPERFAKMLDLVGSRLGNAYRERAQEAIRCYGAHAYLACCAMCGAATESILLSVAIEKTQDEKSILRDYDTSGGRGRIEKIILSGEKETFKNEFRMFTSLLKYWRDAASHGKIFGIADNEAYTSLGLLLRFSKFVFDNWENLTKKV
jgi:hypothetical protein